MVGRYSPGLWHDITCWPSKEASTIKTFCSLLKKQKLSPAKAVSNGYIITLDVVANYGYVRHHGMSDHHIITCWPKYIAWQTPHTEKEHPDCKTDSNRLATTLVTVGRWNHATVSNQPDDVTGRTINYYHSNLHILQHVRNKKMPNY